MKNRRTLVAIGIISLGILVCIAAFHVNKNRNLTKGIQDTMDKKYTQYNGFESFPPVVTVIPTNNNVDQIFSIPFMNSIGTYYVEDGITALKCSSDIAKIEKVFTLTRTYFLGADQIFCSLPINKDEIIWGHNMVFNIVNFKSNKELGFGIGLNRCFQKMSVIDPKDYKMLLKIWVNEGVFEYRIVKLEPDYTNKNGWGNYKILAELPSDEKLQSDLDFWHRDGAYFFYNRAKHCMQAYNGILKSIRHPIADILMEYPNEIVSLLVHPTLPFAFFIGLIDNPKHIYSKQTYGLIRWEHDDNEKKLILYPMNEVLKHQNSEFSTNCRNLQFSPDGNWIILHDCTDNSENPEIIAIPIQKDNPMYLGKPVYLGKALREGAKLKSFAWIEDPMTYVICDGKILYSWELGKIKDRLEYKK